MAFQILNQSIDIIEFTPISSVNSIADFNDINSGTEYFSEIIFGFKDLFPEFQKKKDNKQSQTAKHITIKLLQPSILLVPQKACSVVIQFAYPTDEEHSFLFLKDITPRPPEA